MCFIPDAMEMSLNSIMMLIGLRKKMLLKRKEMKLLLRYPASYWMSEIVQVIKASNLNVHVVHSTSKGISLKTDAQDSALKNKEWNAKSWWGDKDREKD